MLDWKLSFSDVWTVLVAVVGFIGTYFWTKFKIQVHDEKISELDDRLAAQNAQITELNVTMAKLITKDDLRELKTDLLREMRLLSSKNNVD